MTEDRLQEQATQQWMEQRPFTLAQEIGAEHGRNAASWVELDENTAEQIDRDGQLPDDWFGMSSPLSGEWADGYSVPQLMADAGLDDDGTSDALERGAALADAYEDAYWQAFQDEIGRKVEAMRGPVLDLDPDAAYAVDGWGWGIAWRLVGQTFGGKARVVMVGDDREHVVDADDLRVLPEEDYCHECGQVGCKADGRDRS